MTTDNPSITIKNFKSYKNATLPLAPLTLLIGANASGKSNAIEALRFLSWVAGGERLSTLKNRVNDKNTVVRGHVVDLIKKSEDEFILLFSDGKNVQYEGIFQTQLNDISLIHEVINSSEHFIYIIKSVIEPFTSKKSKYFKDWVEDELVDEDYLEEFENVISITLDEHNFCLVDIDTDISTALDINYVYKTLKKHFQNTQALDDLTDFHTVLKKSYFYDFIPKQMRNDSLKNHTLDMEGSNLAGVMYQICEDNIDNKSKLLKIIQSLPEQQINDIVFYPDRRGRVEFALVESYGTIDNRQSNECPMDLLSDGTLKVLAIATALLSVDEGATLVIEEIDNSIHPSRANEMLSLMREIADERKLKLLLSTHNPALMDALPDEALADVVFCYRDPNEGDSRLTRLGDLDDYIGLMVQGSLGDLVTQGVVERFVKHPTTSEERKQKKMTNGRYLYIGYFGFSECVKYSKR